MNRFNINFIGKRKVSAMLSGVLVLGAVVSLIGQGLNLGLDYTGGLLIEFRFEHPVVQSEIRTLLNQSDFEDAVLQQYGTDKEILIRIPTRAGRVDSQVRDKLLSVFQVPDQKVTLRRIEYVGPSVGKELLEQGMLGLIVALLGILIYVMVRYEYRFATGAVVALIHDALITFGIFSWFSLEFDLTGLAAILTIIGYSINDTIVVYDRIRENFRKFRNMPSETIVNISLNETLARTINTSFTTLLVVIALYFWGGALIHNFAIAMGVGIVVGTYSSIYIASSIALAMGVKSVHLAVSEKKEEEVI
ncbi:MAG: protein translocase subunit SecF [Gammaproteobacteria bacterium]|nr:protein translocase subunit SecF [Gammaproteobacteria bacterium]